MKNFFEQNVKEEVLNRIDRLTPESRAQWGRMNVNQALRHLTMAMEVPTGNIDPTPEKVPNVPKWLLRFFLLKIKPPKGKAETFKEMNIIANQINPEDFAIEQQSLKAAVENLFMAEALLPENKLAGKFTKTDWGKLTYNHTDHHLRQFGV